MTIQFARLKRLACFGLITLGSASALLAQSIDFESNTYLVEKTIAEIDGWSKSSDASPTATNNFLIKSGEGNKWVQSTASTSVSINHSFPDLGGITQLRWRWRASSDNVHFCVGVMGNSASVKVGSRAAVCLDTNGTILTQGLSDGISDLSWQKDTWYYMRVLINTDSNVFSVYLSSDSLHTVEQSVVIGANMSGVGPVSKVFLRTEGGVGTIDVDDIEWEGVATWLGYNDTSWSAGSNWSTGKVPDNFTNVVFTSASGKSCGVDKNAIAKSIKMDANWGGKFSLGTSILDITDNVDLTGGTFTESANGFIRLSGMGGQSLIGPGNSRNAPSIRHNGNGVIRLDSRPFFGINFLQAQGQFDFNGFNVSLTGDLTIKNGQPNTLLNLDGSNITVGHSARFEGTSKDTLLGLASNSYNGTALKGWNISANDSIVARFATIGNSHVTSALTGFAFQSSDIGGNSKWAFAAPPTILIPPKDLTLNTGDVATFKISTKSNLPANFQWLRNDVDILGAKDSIYTVTSVLLADNNATFSCKVSNIAGSVTSLSARLKVSYPAPAAQPVSQEFLDSLPVTIIPSVVGSKILISKNGSPFAESPSAFTLRDSTVLKAYTTFNGDTSATATYNYSKHQLPLLDAPIISPISLTFTDSLLITISSSSTSAPSPIYFTLDQSDPDSSKTLYTKPFTINATSVVNARAMQTGYRSSAIRTQIYIRKSADSANKLGPPSATPQGGIFTDSQLVTLNKPAASPNATLYYAFLGDPFAKYTAPFLIKKPGILKILAMQGAAISDTVSYTFSQKVESPIASPKGRSFPDTINISLSTKISGASIYYTLDGKDPFGPKAYIYMGNPIRLDTSATLKMVATKGYDSSAIVTETYLLLADTPIPSFHGGDYSSKIQIELQTSTIHAQIYYTLDGTTPGPENGKQPYTSAITLDTTATLKAVAITKQNGVLTRSSLLVENYNFILPGKRILNPGQQLELSTNYSLTSPSTGASQVVVDLINVDSLRTLKGFRDIQFAIKLSLPVGSTAFPPVIFKAPTGERRSLYSLGSQNTVLFLTDSTTQTLQAPGTYFLALDTLPPKITLSGESFTPQDSTRAIFTIQDNVSNLVMDLERTDFPAGNINGKPIGNPEVITVLCRNPLGSLQPLTLKIRVSDHHQQSSFPSEIGAYHSLSQKNSGLVHTPAAFQIGANPNNLWDLITLPLATRPPLTLGQIRSNISEPKLAAAIWDQTLNQNQGDYKFLSDNDSLTPGVGIWLSAPNSIASFTFPSLSTLPREETGAYELTLHKGWNQVANPSLSTLYWPVTRKLKDVYDLSPLKGLHAYDALKASFVQVDSLLPWRGYFVYYKGNRDTVVQLRFQPVDVTTVLPIAASQNGSPTLLKSSVNAGVSLIFNVDQNPVLRIGASPKASDGLGFEDETRPPSQARNQSGIWSQRLGTPLETDILNFTPQSILTWSVIGEIGINGNTTENSSITLENLQLPSGYSLWAVSRSRGLKFPMQVGAALPFTQLKLDTLEIVAGPAAAVALRLAAIPVSVDAFKISALSIKAGSFYFALNLPTTTQIHWSLYTLDGKLKASDFLHLSKGIYQQAPAPLKSAIPTGLYLLRLNWKSETENGNSGTSGQISQKITIR